MSWIHSLLVTSIIGTGIAVVIGLVSMITGETSYMMAGVLAIVFAIAWFWVHRSMADTELHSHQHNH